MVEDATVGQGLVRDHGGDRSVRDVVTSYGHDRGTFSTEELRTRWRHGAGSSVTHEVLVSLRDSKGHVNKERVVTCLAAATVRLVISSAVAGDEHARSRGTDGWSENG
jgi:hypothetical protein